jgi:AI-2 transport protein TqsA
MSEDRTDPLRGLQALALVMLLAVLVGHVLVVGKNILMPIIVAIIFVYILVTASRWIARQPWGRLLPNWLRQLLVIGAFMSGLILLGGVIASTAAQMAQRLPFYQENLTVILDQMLGTFGLSEGPDLMDLWTSLTAPISLQGMAFQALGSFASLGGVVFLVALYASFLLAERETFHEKIAAALPGEGSVRVVRLIAEINRNIGSYLTTKTLINALLGAVSFVILWLFGLDFAIFWAVLIALLNYIPYVGSYIGVFFPAVLSLAQFGSLPASLGLTALLIAAQFTVGNIIEPRLIGRMVNMSPFVVMAALSIWAALWGILGAILAVPLTSVLLIVLAGFQSTRPFAILLAHDVTAFDRDKEAARDIDPPG